MNTPVSNSTSSTASGTAPASSPASSPAAAEELMRRIEADLVKMLERGAAGRKVADGAAEQQGKAQG